MDNPVRSVDAEKAIDAVAVAITVTAQVGQNRSIVMQTYLPRDAVIDEYHDVLDKVSKAVDRQEAKNDLVQHKVHLAQEEKTLQQMTDDFQSIEKRAAEAWTRSNKKGEPRLSPAEESQKSTARTNIERYREAIKRRKDDIATCEAVIAARD